MNRNAFRTYSGHMLDLSNPDDAVISAEDLAHHLARVCRFGGSIDGYYSVASHCVYVSRQLQAEGHSPYVQAAGLLHDAAEAYLGDVVSGLKRLLPDYRKIEDVWTRRIEDAFDVYWANRSYPTGRAVKDADLRARLSETRDLFRETPYDRIHLIGGEDGLEPYAARVVEEAPCDAEWSWLARARELGLVHGGGTGT